MKVRTIYPEHPLPENEWYQYIYNLLTKPYDKKTGSSESVHANKRRNRKAREQGKQGGKTPTNYK